MRVIRCLRIGSPEAVPIDPDAVLAEVRGSTDDLLVVVAVDGSAEVIPVAP
ncbi:MAG: hypothetical protein CM1200mP26_30090 [Acidimicrobiales bacterium]|nr:MAG: hypothetical protein CM1200mP26_30090 [Acidimicrobiales bacterium]